MRARPKIVFFAEEVTLAHVGRIVALSSALDPRRYEAVIACGARYRRFAEGSGLRVVPIESMAGEEFNRRLAAGEPVYPAAWLKKLVSDDLAVLEHEAPDLVVGDFRCSLGISAELARVPYFSLINGAWSPSSTLSFPMPENILERLFGLTLGGALFRLALPSFLARNRRDFNELRRAVGLAPVGSLQEMYTLGTKALYTDIPALAPVTELPRGHDYLGPVLWEPEVPLPEWWNDVPSDRPVVYASMGTSGDKRAMGRLVEGLAKAEVTTLLATAGHELPANLGPRVFSAPMLPGLACAKRADLVVCNGGSGAVYQALSHGKPVLGIPSNADQYLVMEALSAQGAGRFIRAGHVSAEAVATEAEALLDSRRALASAERLRQQVIAHDGPTRFVAVIDDWFAGRSTDTARGVREVAQPARPSPARPQALARVGERSSGSLVLSTT